MKMNNGKMRCVIYARYGNIENKALTELQIKKCKDFINEQGYVYVGKYVDNASGLDTNRPQFQQMIADSKNDMFDGIVYYQGSHFSRDLTTYIRYKRMLNSKNIKLFDISFISYIKSKMRGDNING